jgi:uncharacterized membrane protein YbaN (DUF454 family)
LWEGGAGLAKAHLPILSPFMVKVGSLCLKVQGLPSTPFISLTLFQFHRTLNANHKLGKRNSQTQ